MNREIIIGDGYTAVVEDGKLVEYFPADPSEQTGDILLGKVERMMPSAGCAFVDIGRSKCGYLPVPESSQSFSGMPVRSGDRILVQIKKEETRDKGVYLTRDIVIAGKYVLLMPMNRYIGVSSRITEPSVRKELLRFGRETSGDRFGLVFRTAAEKAEVSRMAEEIERLRSLAFDLLSDTSGQQKTGVIYHHEKPEDQLIRDYENRGIQTVSEAGALRPELRNQLEIALQKKVRLPNGGNIVIEPCEALTVIDVNSSSDHLPGERNETIRRINMEACREIGTQIRLRNLSGIIIVDLIDLDLPEDREAVLQYMHDILEQDRIKTVIHGMTSLGLLEITRKRTRPPLAETIRRQNPGAKE